MSLEKILQKAQRHCEQVIQPNIEKWNDLAKFPRKAASESGLTGLFCPKKWGGAGLSLEAGICVYEELGKGDGAYAFALSMHNICSYVICNFASEDFQASWAENLITGRKFANFALTEPQSGSDPSKMHTTATQTEDGWKISGSKAWVSLANEADIYLVVAKTSDKPGYEDMAMFAVPLGAEGLSFGKPYPTASYRFLGIAEMYLENVNIPAKNIILPAGKGLSGSLMAIDIARTSIAAGCCGLMQTALDIALRYTRDRKMFNKTSLELDGIQWMLGEVATDIELSRLIYQKAASSLGTSEGTLFAAHAKRFAPDAALKATNICTQALGGMGLLNPYQLTRLNALAQMLKIVDGTTEIQRVVIGRSLKKKAAELPAIEIPKGYGQ